MNVFVKYDDSANVGWRIEVYMIQCSGRVYQLFRNYIKISNALQFSERGVKTLRFVTGLILMLFLHRQNWDPIGLRKLTSSGINAFPSVSMSHEMASKVPARQQCESPLHLLSHRLFIGELTDCMKTASHKARPKVLVLPRFIRAALAPLLYLALRMIGA
jgi:hypothetical protein